MESDDIAAVFTVTALVIPPDARTWRQLLICPDFVIIPIRTNETSHDHAATDRRTFDANQC